METELWQVEVGGQIYETDFSELKQWIADRALLPTDNVRKGNLRWTKANRVPALQKYFSDELVAAPVAAEIIAPESETAPSAEVSTVAAAAQVRAEPATAAPKQQFAPTAFQPQAEQTRAGDASAFGEACCFHPEAEPFFVCKNCANRFCKNCPKAFGSVRICPICDQFCDPFKAAAQKTQKQTRARQSRTPFGFADFGEALTYPFKFKTSLFFGALFYALLLLGGIFGGLLANMILFGCISLSIGQIARGNLDRNFMPDWDEFSIWDDAFKPLFLSMAINLVCWLPLVLVFLVVFWGAFGKMSEARNKAASGKVTASPIIVVEGEVVQWSADKDGKTVEDAPRVELTREEHRAMGENPMSAAGQSALRKIRQAEMQVAFGKALGVDLDPTASDGEKGRQIIFGVLKNGFAPIVLLALALLWGLFYYPMALTLAGYTRSVRAVLNPLVGLDTMERMGANYFRAFAMCLGVIILGNAAGVVIGIATAPFDLPFVGNLPGNFVYSLLIFYYSLAMAAILGLALFKSGDRLDIS